MATPTTKTKQCRIRQPRLNVCGNSECVKCGGQDDERNMVSDNGVIYCPPCAEALQIIPEGAA